MEFKLFDIVVSLVSKDCISKGQEGTIVEIWKNDGLFEVEFLNNEGNEIGTYTMKKAEIRKVE